MKTLAVGYMSGVVPDFWEKHFFNVEPDLPVEVVVEDSGGPLPPLNSRVSYRTIPKLREELLDKVGVPRSTRSNVYAWWAFTASLLSAKDAGYPFMLYFEEDCRFSPNWGSRMAREFDFYRQFNDDLKWAGTPVIWHPWSLGYFTSAAVFNYGAKVLEHTKLPMACEGSHSGPFSLYPNGALAIYDVSWTLDLLSDFASLFSEIQERRGDVTELALRFIGLAVRFTAFDLCLGVRSYSLYGGNVFKMGHPLACSYSGCRDHHVPLSNRIEFWRSGFKVAVHHIKESELPF